MMHVYQVGTLNHPVRGEAEGEREMPRLKPDSRDWLVWKAANAVLEGQLLRHGVAATARLDAAAIRRVFEDAQGEWTFEEPIAREARVVYWTAESLTEAEIAAAVRDVQRWAQEEQGEEMAFLAGRKARQESTP